MGRSRLVSGRGVQPALAYAPPPASGHDGLVKAIGSNLAGYYVNAHDRGVVASSSSYYDGNYLAPNALYRGASPGSRPWHSNNAGGSWWAIDFGATRRVKPEAIHIQQRSDGATNLYGNLNVRGSNDFTNWDENIATFTSPTQSQYAWNTQAIAPGSRAPYRYLMILSTGVDSGGANYLIIGEVEIFGTLLAA